MLLTMVIAGAAGTTALAGSSSVTFGCPWMGVPSGAAGVPTTVPVLVCWTPAAGAARAAVQVIDSATARVVAGQVMPDTLSSVTVTDVRTVLPVLVTR